MLNVTLAFAPAQRQALELPLQLPAGATVQDALDALAALAARGELASLAAQAAQAGLVDAADLPALLDALPDGLPDLPPAPGCLGVWGRPAEATQPLREGDRVEIWRPLQVDPKVARRERFGRQGARAAGLFARRRPGAKPGY